MRTLVRRLLRGAPKHKPKKTKPSRGSITYSGDYENWEAARAASGGYEAANILETVRASAGKARDGLAAFERDGVAFDRPEYRWPMLACLMWARAQSRKDSFHVVDFGGSLGSVYFQHRAFLDAFPELRWTVVEQQHFVELGKREFQVGVLAFCETMKRAAENAPIDVLLFYGVLQYLPDPYLPLTEAAENSPVIIVDRTPFIPGARDKLVVQSVPSQIYSASFPHWFLAEERFSSFLRDRAYVQVGAASPGDEAARIDMKRPHKNYPTFMYRRAGQVPVVV